MASLKPKTTLAQDTQISIAEYAPGSLHLTDSKWELNAKTRIVSLLSTEIPHILAQQQFSRNEWSLLLTFLVSYPHYAPYEILLASLTSLSIDNCHQRIQDAQHLGAKALKRELKPVHRALAGLRTKLGDLSPHHTNFIIGIEYKDSNYRGDSLAYSTTGLGCSPYQSFGVTSMPSGWDNVISSVSGDLDYCYWTVLWENTNYGGARLNVAASTSYVGNAMNDQTSSIYWRCQSCAL